MRDIRKRGEKTDNIFEPLKDTVTLLSNYGVNFNEKVSSTLIKLMVYNKLLL